MSVQMLQNVIWTRFFTKHVCWQNSVVIFEKSYLPHMTSFLAKTWSIDSYLIQESKNIEFGSIGLLQIKIFKSKWLKVNIGRLQDLTLKAAISMSSLFYFLALDVQKGMNVSFLMSLESLHFDLQSSRSAENID